MKKVILSLLPLVLLLVGCGDGAEQEQIKATEFRDRWPFSFKEAALLCKPWSDSGIAVAVEAPDGKQYWLNGAGKIAFPDALDLDETGVWLDDPRPLMSKLDLSPIVRAGRKLCGAEGGS